jgi:glutamyl/glutaminyl-tRNA synthetase
VIGRLAPTPSGDLHLGNALAFGAAWISARSQGGKLLLRIEDIDQSRAREEVAKRQREDLLWLGLSWDMEVSPQSKRSYSLTGIPTWRCQCSRALRLAGGCTCRNKQLEAGVWRFAGSEEPVVFLDRAWGKQCLKPEPGPILMRAAGEPAYPLAVVVDDGRDGVTEVVRGADLLEATPVQVQLHRILKQPEPSYLHTPVLYSPAGKKLSKSSGSTGIRTLKKLGWSPDDIWALLLPLLGATPPLESARMFFTGWKKGWVLDESFRLSEKR